MHPLKSSSELRLLLLLGVTISFSFLVPPPQNVSGREVDLPGSQHLQHHLLAIGVGEPNLHFTLFNNEEGSFWVTGCHDDLTRLKPSLLHDRTKLTALF